MSIIVKKYGGTSIGGFERMHHIARQIKSSLNDCDKQVIVLSAMSGRTNALYELAKQMHSEPNPQFMDMLLATGEQESISLFAMCLQHYNIPSQTFLSFQAGIQTDSHHGCARIASIDSQIIHRALSDMPVVIVAGFQGIDSTGAITTIGRGGSDTTAVAIAASLDATYCEINTDVAGVFTADPKICDAARCLEKISYEEMMELADAGAKVLHTRCVELAAKYRLPLIVKSSFLDVPGTWVVPEEEMEEEIMEGQVVSGITCDMNEAKVSIRHVPDKVGVTEAIFAPIAAANINVDLIIQNVSEAGYTDLTFTVCKENLRKAISLAEVAAKRIDAGHVIAAGDIAKISVVGLGMRSHAGVAHLIFKTLASEGIAVQMIGTSEIKVSMVIDAKYAELAVRSLHESFELDKNLAILSE